MGKLTDDERALLIGRVMMKLTPFRSEDYGGDTLKPTCLVCGASSWRYEPSAHRLFCVFHPDYNPSEKDAGKSKP